MYVCRKNIIKIE